MRRFGFKIVDRCRGEIEPLVERALLERRPLEVGLYFGERAALDLLVERLPDRAPAVAVHLDHRRLSIFDLERREPELREQLALAGRLGAAYVVTHLSPYPMTPRPERREDLLGRLCTGLRFAGRICADHGLDVHIENTFHGLAFYRWLHQRLLDLGMDGVNVCFDLGHAKVWSKDRLGDWLDLLDELHQAGRRLHFPLHAHRGLVDEHLSFVQAERLGLTAPDGFTGDLDYYGALAEIARRFPSAAKVFEVPAAEAEANLDHVLARIASLQGLASNRGREASPAEEPSARQG
jgi:sugar phosphate isomerase/epimerase